GIGSGDVAAIWFASMLGLIHETDKTMRKHLLIVAAAVVILFSASGNAVSGPIKLMCEGSENFMVNGKKADDIQPFATKYVIVTDAANRKLTVEADYFPA